MAKEEMAEIEAKLKRKLGLESWSVEIGRETGLGKLFASTRLITFRRYINSIFG